MTQPVPISSTPVHELFERQTAHRSDALALSCGGSVLSYGELNARANQMAHFLSGYGVMPEITVGLSLDTSLEAIVTVFGILKAGGVYVPLDSALPTARLQDMLRQLGIRLVVTSQTCRKNLPDIGPEVICLDTAGERIREQSRDNLRSGVHPDNLAYITYTSGSTGTPKGVMATHRSITAHLAAVPFEPDREGQVCCLNSPLSFAFSVSRLFMPLLCGVPLVLLTTEQSKDPEHLVRIIHSEKITSVGLVTPLVREILSRGSETASRLQHVRTVVTGGSVVSSDLIRAFTALLPQTELINGYAATEIGGPAIVWRSGPVYSSHAISNGKAFPNTKVYILDGNMTLISGGTVADIYVAASHLARGYVNDPALTAEKFRPNPFGTPGERMYWTGDRGRHLPNGEIEICGRSDSQVKIRGFRVDLIEIENMLHAHECVCEVAVTTANKDGDEQIIAYIALQPGRRLTHSQLRSYLSRHLPEYMVPSMFVEVARLPRTSHGKIDIRALPVPGNARPDLEVEYRAPRNPTEAAIAQIWAEHLGLEAVGINDNFIELGGDSISASRLQMLLGERLGLEVTPDRLRRTTVEELAALKMSGEVDVLGATSEYINLVNEPLPPFVEVSSDRKWAVFLHRRHSLPSDAELPAKSVYVAGTTIDAAAYSQHKSVVFEKVVLFDIASRQERVVATGPDSTVYPIGFSPDNDYYAFAVRKNDVIQPAWVRLQDASLTLASVRLNATMLSIGMPIGIWANSRPQLLCRLAVNEDTQTANTGPEAPVIYETGRGPNRITEFPTSIQSGQEERLMRQYFRSRLGVVDIRTAAVNLLGEADYFADFSVSADGTRILVEKLLPPFARIGSLATFRRRTEIWGLSEDGHIQSVMAVPSAKHSELVQDAVWEHRYRWHPTESRTLVWSVRDSASRDHIVASLSDGQSKPWLLLAASSVCADFAWTTNGRFLAWERDVGNQTLRVHVIDEQTRESAVAWEAPIRDAFLLWHRERIVDGEIAPIWSLRRHVGRVVEIAGRLFVTGSDRVDGKDLPFLDHIEIDTGCRSRVYSSHNAFRETVVHIMNDDATLLLTQVEAADQRPRYCLVNTRSGERFDLQTVVAVSTTIANSDRHPFRYRTVNGKELSTIVYLPPSQPFGTPVPFVIWIYPELTKPGLELTQTPGGGVNRYIRPHAISPFVFLSCGYGVLHMPPLPIEISSAASEDTWTHQLVRNAECLVTALVDQGYADKTRIIVAGSCHGAYSVAQLLANTRLFRAGIGLSGYYNLTSWPAYRRLGDAPPLWKAPSVYVDRSPLFHADRIHDPVLLICAEDDEFFHDVKKDNLNFFSAIEAAGGTARCVTVAHGGRSFDTVESIRVVLDEMIKWCDVWLRRPSGVRV